jgi:hypothetical protein
MAEEIFDGIQRCIDDESLYLSGAEFFNLLQDKGVDVTDKQRADIEEKLQKKKAKTFTRQILYDYRLYPQLYQLCANEHCRGRQRIPQRNSISPKAHSTAIRAEEWKKLKLSSAVPWASSLKGGIKKDLIEYAESPMK